MTRDTALEKFTRERSNLLTGECRAKCRFRIISVGFWCPGPRFVENILCKLIKQVVPLLGIFPGLARGTARDERTRERLL